MEIKTNVGVVNAEWNRTNNSIVLTWGENKLEILRTYRYTIRYNGELKAIHGSFQFTIWNLNKYLEIDPRLESWMIRTMNKIQRREVTEHEDEYSMRIVKYDDRTYALYEWHMSTGEFSKLGVSTTPEILLAYIQKELSVPEKRIENYLKQLKEAE